MGLDKYGNAQSFEELAAQESQEETKEVVAEATEEVTADTGGGVTDAADEVVAEPQTDKAE